MKRLVQRAGMSALVVMTSGCVEAFPEPPALRSSAPLDPTVFFDGRTHGEGRIRLRIGADQRVRVDGVGSTASDGRFRLDQRVAREGQDVANRTWLMSRPTPETVVASLSDASGEVRGEVSTGQFHLRYLIRQPAVYMEQWMYLHPDGRTVSNHAEISVLGVTWARLTETIVRQAP